MSKELELTLPSPLVQEIRKEPPRTTIIPLLTCDAEGFPHVALLSYFELFVRDGTLCAFLYTGTRSTRFLRQSGRCTLIFLEKEFVYYLKANVRSNWGSDTHQVFSLNLHQVLEDYPHPDEGPVRISSAMQFDSAPAEIEKRMQLRREIMDAFDSR